MTIGKEALTSSTQTSADPNTDKPVGSRKLAVDFRQYGILAALVAIIVLFEVTHRRPRCCMPGNVNNLIQQNSYVLILAIGMVHGDHRRPHRPVGGIRRRHDRCRRSPRR